MLKKDLVFIPRFYDTYINLVSDALELNQALKVSQNCLEEIKEDLLRKENYRYQSDKWTVNDVLQHIVDTERIMAFRALALVREEKQTLFGYDQDAYAKHTNASQKSITHLLTEFKLLRQSNVLMFESFNKKDLLKEGMCGGVKVSVLALGFVLVGHPFSHINTLKERYL